MNPHPGSPETVLAWVVLLWLAALPTALQAQLTCATNNGTISITKYTGSAAAVTIPNAINGLPVTEISAYAFAFNSVTNITIPGTVTSIGTSAFFCSCLTGLTLPEGVKSIGVSAFASCASLTDVTIPSSATYFGSDVFNDCTSLRAILVDPLNPNYSSADGVLFNQNQTTLILCPAAKSGSYAVPSTVRTIKEKAFSCCRSLTGVTLPSSLTTIGEYGFEFCTGLTSITFPGSLTTIGNHAFHACTGLTNVTVPGNLTCLGTGIFAACSGLSAIAVDGHNPAYRSIDGVLFNYNQTTLHQYPPGKSGSYRVPDGVTSIGANAFDRCYALSGILLPNSLTNIGDWAFEECTNLTEVTLPTGITTIRPGAFNYCTSLARVVLPESITSIGSDAFSTCRSLTDLTIPSGVAQVGGWAFAACDSLTRIYFLGSAPTLGPSVFDSGTPATVYYLPGTAGWGSTLGGRPAALWPCAGVRVSLSPPEAIAAGARWQLDGGPWQPSGAILTNLTPANHTLCFSALPGWDTPDCRTVSLSAFQTTPASAAYPAKLPHTATAAPVLVNGFVVGADMVDGGYGYTNPPAIYFVGGGGSGAQATATVSNGIVVGITILDAGFGYTNPPTLVVAPPMVGPLLLRLSAASATRALRLEVQGLIANLPYQFETSTNLTYWTELAPPFTATTETSSHYLPLEAPNIFFRLRQDP